MALRPFSALISLEQKLVDHNVLALPVVTHEGKYNSFVDMLDIVKHVIKRTAMPNPVSRLLDLGSQFLAM